MKSYIRILFFTLAIPSRIEEIAPDVLDMLTKILFSPTATADDLRTRTVIALIAGKQFFKRLLLTLIGSEWVYNLWSITSFLLVNPVAFPTPLGVLYRAESLRAIEFIKLYYLLGHNQITPNLYPQIAAICFRKQADNFDEAENTRTAKVLADLNPIFLGELVENILYQYSQLIVKNKVAFPDVPPAQSGGGREKNWYQILRDLSDNVTELDKVAMQPASSFLFELQERILDARDEKARYEAAKAKNK